MTPIEDYFMAEKIITTQRELFDCDRYRNMFYGGEAGDVHKVLTERSITVDEIQKAVEKL